MSLFYIKNFNIAKNLIKHQVSLFLFPTHPLNFTRSLSENSMAIYKWKQAQQHIEARHAGSNQPISHLLKTQSRKWSWFPDYDNAFSPENCSKRHLHAAKNSCSVVCVTSSCVRLQFLWKKFNEIFINYPVFVSMRL